VSDGVAGVEDQERGKIAAALVASAAKDAGKAIARVRLARDCGSLTTRAFANVTIRSETGSVVSEGIRFVQVHRWRESIAIQRSCGVSTVVTAVVVVVVVGGGGGVGGWWR
jgi:hypothetical protein